MSLDRAARALPVLGLRASPAIGLRTFVTVGVAFVLFISIGGCNELAVHDGPPPHDAVESWATPLRASATNARKSEDKKDKKDKKGSSFFFNDKSREIEESLGL